jgi:sortase A
MGRHTTGTVIDGPAPDPAPPAEGMSTADKVRFVLRGIGQTLITFGLIVLLFVFYEVYVTNWFASEAQAKVQKQLERTWVDGKGDPLAQLPDGSYPDLPLGTGIANLYIPRLGRDYEFAIVQGTSQDDLEKGPGHYPKTALPGQVGNFAVAGHRMPSVFWNIDQLHEGDPIVVETRTSWDVYRVTRNHIIRPTQVSVVAKNPEHPGSPATRKLLTLTTCNPKWDNYQRLVIQAELTHEDPRGTGARPAELGGL